MDTRKASLELLNLGLSEKERKAMSLDSVMDNLQHIHSRVITFKKPECSPDDKKCIEECRRRRERVMGVIKIISPSQISTNDPLKTRIDKLLDLYQQTYDKASLHPDFFDTEDGD
jgi:hypothetical protein